MESVIITQPRNHFILYKNCLMFHQAYPFLGEDGDLDHYHGAKTLVRNLWYDTLQHIYLCKNFDSFLAVR